MNSEPQLLGEILPGVMKNIKQRKSECSKEQHKQNVWSAVSGFMSKKPKQRAGEWECWLCGRIWRQAYNLLLQCPKCGNTDKKMIAAQAKAG